MPGGTLRGSDQRRSGPSIFPAQSAREVCPALGLGPTPSVVPSGPGWSWGHRREARREQERQSRGVLQDQRIRK